MFSIQMSFYMKYNLIDNLKLMYLSLQKEFNLKENYRFTVHIIMIYMQVSSRFYFNENLKNIISNSMHECLYSVYSLRTLSRKIVKLQCLKLETFAVLMGSERFYLFLCCVKILLQYPFSYLNVPTKLAQSTMHF